jgi:hypothetical protein
MCAYWESFAPTVTLMVMALSYLGLTLLIQHRLRVDPGESQEAKNLKFLSHGAINTAKCVAFIMGGRINNPVTRVLRNIDRGLILLLLAGFVLGLLDGFFGIPCGMGALGGW